MIKLKSNKELIFPPLDRGFVTMNVDIIQNKPNEKVYEFRIVDTCTKKVMKDFVVPDLEAEIQLNKEGNQITKIEQKEVEEQVGSSITRFETVSYQDFDEFCNTLPQMQINSETQNENFKKYYKYKVEKDATEGKGLYYSEAGDFEFVD